MQNQDNLATVSSFHTLWRLSLYFSFLSCPLICCLVFTQLNQSVSMSFDLSRDNAQGRNSLKVISLFSIHSFILSSIHPSSLPPFLPSFLPPSLPSIHLSFLPSFHPSTHPSNHWFTNCWRSIYVLCCVFCSRGYLFSWWPLYSELSTCFIEYKFFC